MIRTLIAAGSMIAAFTAAMEPQLASMPPEVPRLETPVEIVGDYAGRMMRLVIDGQVIHDGRAEARAPGTRWLEQVAPGTAPAEVILEIENCPAYRSQIFRSGVLNAISINGCNVMLIGS
jgi:hypothetical protein